MFTDVAPEIPRNDSSLAPGELFRPDLPGRIAHGGLRTRGLYRTAPRGLPLVSVITVVLNGARHLEETIASVLNQTYEHVEYIIVDGGSSDDTLDIVRRYEDRIDYWVSEPDRGISDAFNKGIGLSTGDPVGIINSDDSYEPSAVLNTVEKLNEIPCFSYGACTYIADDGSARTLAPDRNYVGKIRYFMPHIHHPTVFLRRAMYERFGLYDTSLRYAMDYDLMLRLRGHGQIGTAIDSPVARFREQGATRRMYGEVRREVRAVSIRHGANPLVAHLVCLALILKGHMNRHPANTSVRSTQPCQHSR